jgi:hypothetical protein
VEWLDGLAPADLTELFGFLVENAMPGGGKLARGGDKDYLGLKALLQIMLQRVKGKPAVSAFYYYHYYHYIRHIYIQYNASGYYYYICICYRLYAIYYYILYILYI